MTVAELIQELTKFPQDREVWVYTEDGLSEPYPQIDKDGDVNL